MKLLREFRDFAAKGSIVDLAVAVVIGGAFGKIVSAFVADLIMPLVNAVTPGGDWRQLEVTPLRFKIGDFLGTVVDFLIVAGVIFVVIQKMMGATKRPAAEVAPPPTKQCPECLESVPKAARRCRACTSIFLTGLALLVARTGFAQGMAPTGDSAVVEQGAPVEWKAQSKGGFLLTSGNSQATNATFGVNASRKQGQNKLALEGGMAYGKSNLLVPVTTVDSADPATQYVSGYDRRSTVSTNNWAAKARYDRFLTDNNSLYLSGQGAGDKVAGKLFFGGGQVGYSRQLWKSPMHLVVAELGYDLSYLVFQTSDPSISVHSARVFLGETMKITQQTGLTAGVEGLFNLNKETKAKNAGDGTIGVDPFQDTRLNAKVGITTNLYKSLSLGVGFTAKYTQNPAPRPAPAGLKYDPSIPYASYQYAEKTDTLTEATLVYTFF